MTLGQEIESIRRAKNISIWQMCNLLGLSTEIEYDHFIHGHLHISKCQLIMFMDAMRCSLSCVS
jgi:hypothetical protein